MAEALTDRQIDEVKITVIYNSQSLCGEDKLAESEKELARMKCDTIYIVRGTEEEQRTFRTKVRTSVLLQRNRKWTYEMKTRDSSMNVIEVFAPTVSYSEKEVEDEEIQQIVYTSKSHYKIVLGNYNTK